MFRWKDDKEPCTIIVFVNSVFVVNSDILVSFNWMFIWSVNLSIFRLDILLFGC